MKPHWLLLLKDKCINRSTQLETAPPTSHHTPRETMPGTMPSTTNPMRSSGVGKPTPPHQTLSIGLRMVKESTLDSSQEIQPQFLLKRNSHTMMLNQQSQFTTKDLMPGPITKPIRPMRLRGKDTLQLLELTILTLPCLLLKIS